MGTRTPKILITADAVGGIWTYALDLGRGLVGRGMTTTLAVLGPGLDDGMRRAASQAGLDLVELGHPPEWLADGPGDVALAGKALEAVARRAGIDLVHLNHPALGATALFDLPVLSVCHSCVATWWAAVERTPLPNTLAWQADLVGAGYRAADALVAPSSAFAEATRAAYALPGAPTVVHNGRAAVLAGGPRPDPVQSALTVGRLWDAGKGVATLDRAAALARIPIRAAGPTTGPNGATVALSALEALGPLPEGGVRALLGERPIFVSAATYEPFGLSILEAAQAGCALVLSDIPTLRELWSEAALFVAADSAEGFARAIDRLGGDPALRARLADAAHRRAALYGVERQVERIVGIYASLLGRDERGRHTA